MRSGLVVALGLALAAPAWAQDGGQPCYVSPGNGFTSGSTGSGACHLEVGGDTGHWLIDCSGSSCTCEVNGVLHQFAYSATDPCNTSLLDRCCDAPLATASSSTSSTSGTTGSSTGSTGSTSGSTGSTATTSSSSASSTAGASTGGVSASSSTSSSSGSTSTGSSAGSTSAASSAGSTGGAGTSGGGCGCTQADPAGLTLLGLALAGLGRRRAGRTGSVEEQGAELGDE